MDQPLAGKDLRTNNRSRTRFVVTLLREEDLGLEGGHHCVAASPLSLSAAKRGEGAMEAGKWHPSHQAGDGMGGGGRRRDST